MPAKIEDESAATDATTLPFPAVTKQHILNCSYHKWHPQYRAITPKARLIPLTQPFLDYLRADGIVLPSDEDDDNDRANRSDSDSGIFAHDEDADSDASAEDIAADWRDLHSTIQRTIASLGGAVVPKLNWSAPKDATWMNGNTMECRSANDVYLLLKSSDFVTHDLEHAFDDTEPTPGVELTIPYHLVLRKAVTQWNPSVEFRCFVRRRRLLCLCQRTLNHWAFLSRMAGRLVSLIQEFFDVRLRDTFPEENFTFDVYVPAPHDRVWLVDFNPWAPRTDPLLFSWREILTMPEPPEPQDIDAGPEIVRLSLHPIPAEIRDALAKAEDETVESEAATAAEDDDSDSDSSIDEELWLPELRLVQQNDPEAWTMNAPQYSAHKLPRDVVDAAKTGEGMSELLRDWREIMAKQEREDEDGDSEVEG